jgi:Cd2+/Zn2+-exporting ATPase
VTQTQPAGGTTQVQFRVTGMDCAEEVGALRRVLEPLDGVTELGFDILAQRLSVRFDPARLDVATLREAVRGVGLRALPWSRAGAARPEGPGPRDLLVLCGSALLAAALVTHAAAAGGLVQALGGSPSPPVTRWLYGLSVALGLLPLLPRALAALRSLRPDMNLLMLVAIAGALLLGDWMEAATVATLFALSLQLEAWSVGRARRAVEALLDVSPSHAELLDETAASETSGETAGAVETPTTARRVPAAEVAVGSLLLVRPGARVPLDGRIVGGASELDESPLTGEPRPVLRQGGDEVWAGTINGSGALTVRTTRAADDTTLARVIRMVESAQGRRGPSERFVERFARVYTPVVMGLAALVCLVPPLLTGRAFGAAFYDALVLLVIACPCALVISTPVSVVCALATAARQGVLIKGGRFVEEPARMACLAFDKTGTLTAGRPVVESVVPFDHHDEHDLLCTAAAIEAQTSHPVGTAILARAHAAGCPHRTASDVRHLPGRGAQARVDGRDWWLGSHRLLEERGQETPAVHAHIERLEADGRTVVILGNERHVCGLFVLVDAERPAAARAVADLHGLGLSPLVMLTGDHARAAAELAGRLGLDEVRAGLLPADKLAAVEELLARHGHVAMVGEGVNDAPAMARASLGIAMGAVGTDAAIESADIVIMSDDLSRLPWLVRHSRRTVAIIRQNIVAALGIKAAFIVLAAAGHATLWAAIAADMGVSLAVVANALRLLAARERPDRRGLSASAPRDAASAAGSDPR